MAFETGPVGIGEIRTFFVGPTPSRMSNYYKNGAYVPSTKTVLEPGPNVNVYNYSTSAPRYYVEYSYINPFQQGAAGDSNWNGIIYWDGVEVVSVSNLAAPILFEVDAGGGVFYYAGFVQFIDDFFDPVSEQYFIYSDRFNVRKSSNTTINTDIPVSETIRLSNFRGADK